VIPDQPKIGATMKVVYRGPGQRTNVADQTNPAYVKYNGRIAIERHGLSSQWANTTTKYSYGFKTVTAAGAELDVPLLWMPTELSAA